MASFKKQVISSSKWAFINQLVTQVVRLSVSVYLMRLLEPESFGVFMKVLSVIGISEILIGLRLGGGLVQAKSPTKKQISTVFWLTLISSILLSFIFYSIAPTISTFYDDPRLTLVMQATCITIIFMGIGYIPRTLLVKELEFKKIFYVNFLGIIVSSIIGIAMALNNYSYWSLVWQWVSFNISISILYFGFSKYKVKFHLNLIDIKLIWSFSKNIALNDSLNYFVRNIDNVLIGKMTGTSALGLYSKAYGLMLLPLQNFTGVINSILFPSLSKIKDDVEKISKLFVRALQITSSIITPVLLFALFFEQEIISVVLGNKWNGIFVILRIFLLLGLIQSHTTLSISMFYATGNSKIPLNLSYFSKPILLVAIFITAFINIETMALSILIVSGSFSFVQLFLALKLSKISMQKLIMELKFLFLVHISTIILLGVLHELLLAYYSNSMTIIIAFPILVLALVLVYEFFKPPFYTELRKSIL